MKKTNLVLLLFLVFLIGSTIPLLVWSGNTDKWIDSSTWQRMASPGELSKAHAFLENKCNACHTPVKGIEATNCIVCHANNKSLLQRQPTAFHADIGTCRECHLEHRGTLKRPTVMDHTALSRIGIRQLKRNPSPDSEDYLAAQQLTNWIEHYRTKPGHPQLTPEEKILNCITCHKNDDRHFGLFGNDCAQCHITARWTNPEFLHPPSTSLDCAQCHQAPPSHYMMHYNMISQKVAGKPRAEVEQCYLCHQTTAWPDIIDVGWYKHH